MSTHAGGKSRTRTRASTATASSKQKAPTALSTPKPKAPTRARAAKPAAPKASPKAAVATPATPATVPPKPTTATARKAQATATAKMVMAHDAEMTRAAQAGGGPAWHPAYEAREEALRDLRAQVAGLTPAARRAVLSGMGISEAQARRWGLLAEGETLAKPAPRSRKKAG